MREFAQSGEISVMPVIDQINTLAAKFNCSPQQAISFVDGLSESTLDKVDGLIAFPSLNLSKREGKPKWWWCLEPKPTYSKLVGRLARKLENGSIDGFINGLYSDANEPLEGYAALRYLQETERTAKFTQHIRLQQHGPINVVGFRNMRKSYHKLQQIRGSFNSDEFGFSSVMVLGLLLCHKGVLSPGQGITCLGDSFLGSSSIMGDPWGGLTYFYETPFVRATNGWLEFSNMKHGEPDYITPTAVLLES